MPRAKKPIAELNIDGPMAERMLPDGRRKLKLNQRERKDMIRSRQVETAVALFLDLEHDHNWEEMASAVGLSVVGLKDLTKSDEFISVYNEHFVELGHDPRLQASKGALVDMLPSAIRELKGLLGRDTPPTVRLNAIKEVLRLNGLEANHPIQSDKREYADFLKNAGMQINQVNVTMPAEFAAKVGEYVDAEFKPLRVEKE